ncbi:MAG: glycosyltransferase [Anaerolineae bacterium]|nr:glycosyltransferase [Anaerolineae bacterium]
MDYVLSAANIECVDIGPHVSIPQRIIGARRFTQPLRNQRHQLDAILIRGPSPLLPAMARAAGDLPTALLLVGDYVAATDDLRQPRWRKEAIRLWSRWNQWQERQIAHHALTFVNSRKLYEQLRSTVPNLVETRTTTLTASDFFEREDTCIARPIRLLYTGRLDRGKGLLLIVQAVSELVAQGDDIVFDLVGWAEKGDDVEAEIRQLADRLGIGGRVLLHGFKPVGPTLFAHYRQADIYVIASTGSEGFPRTIWEAMAHSLPVVATRVGSIPLYLEDRENVMLVQPGASGSLALAIRKLVAEPDLRRRLIASGIKTARENTVERRVEEMAHSLQDWLRPCQN